MKLAIFDYYMGLSFFITDRDKSEQKGQRELP